MRVTLKSACEYMLVSPSVVNIQFVSVVRSGSGDIMTTQYVSLVV